MLKIFQKLKSMYHELQEYLFYDDYRKRKGTLETKKCRQRELGAVQMLRNHVEGFRYVLTVQRINPFPASLKLQLRPLRVNIPAPQVPGRFTTRKLVGHSA